MSNLLDGKVLSKFKQELNDSLSTAFKNANNQNKEVELTVKINIGILSESDNDEHGKEPKFEYQVTKKVKETKLAFKGEIKDAELEFDENDNPRLISTDNQLNLYEEKVEIDNVEDADVYAVEEEPEAKKSKKSKKTKTEADFDEQ
jgi:uncharacterized membrane protein